MLAERYSTPQEGSQDLGGQKKKLQQLTAVWAEAQHCWGGWGKCVTLLVSTSISVMDELSSKQEMKTKRQKERVTEHQKAYCHDSVNSQATNNIIFALSNRTKTKRLKWNKCHREEGTKERNKTEAEWKV